MSDYFKAYRGRLEKNQTDIINLINEVKKVNPLIKAYVVSSKNRIISSVTFIKGEEINRIGFHEVPYRWSGCGYKEHHSSHYGLSMPFTANDVLKTFQSIKGMYKNQSAVYKNAKEYLTWNSYLTEYTNE